MQARKNARWRAIPLTADAKAARKRLGSDRLVECHPDTLGDWFAAEARSVGLRGSLHWLRHTFCTALVQSGVSLHEVKRLAGHSSIAVTERYAHTERRLREALSVLGKIAGTAEATKQRDGIAYLQNMAREAWLKLGDPRGPPSMAPTVKR